MSSCTAWRRGRGRISAALVLSIIVIGLAACQPSESIERTTSGETIYLDRLNDAQKAAARQKILESVRRGIGPYKLGIGDELTAYFHVHRKLTTNQYRIAVADELRVEFLGDTQNSQTVTVRPDGRISLPLIGSVRVTGETPSLLARQLQERYTGLLAEPKIAVNLTTTHTPLDDFLEVLSTDAKSRAVSDKVMPDGTISLPLLQPLSARGQTLKQLEQAIDDAYAAKGLDVSVSLVPSKLTGNTTLVIGEIGKPGPVELDRPTTVAMAVAAAGGISRSGAADAVRIFYIGDDGLPRARSINLNEVLDGFRIEDDMIVPRDSIIYVPPSELAKADRIVDGVMKDILRFQGFNIAGTLLINPSNTSNQTVITTTTTK